MSAYDTVIPGALRLKKGQGVKKKKKHHKKAVALAENVDEETTEKQELDADEKTPTKNEPVVHLTKAQIEWERKRDKRVLESVLSKADKSHKQRIIEFNNYLSTLTEHFDIQKVSWTK